MTNFLESNFSDYEVRRLRKDETIKSFDCGDADLNDFIWNRAESYNKAIPCRLGEIALRNFKVEAVKTKILSERSEFIFVQRRR